MAIDSEPLGNVRSNSLMDIKNNSKVWDFMIKYNDIECENCEHKKVCNGGCRYYPSTEKEKKDIRCNYNKIVPLCPIMKYNFKNNKIGGSSEDVMVD